MFKFACRVADCIDTKGIIRIHIESGLAECQASADLAAVENNPLDLVGEGISTIRNIRVVPISAFVKKRADETSRKKDITAKPKLMFCGYKLKRTNRMQVQYLSGE